jgi:serine protease AprX
LWGKGGRGFVFCLVAMFLLVPLVATASDKNRGAASYLTPGLLAQAGQHPGAKIRVIITADETSEAVDAGKKVGKVDRKLPFVNGAAVEMPAARLASLAKIPGLTITPDAPVKVSGGVKYTSNQIWPYESGLAKTWPTDTNQPKPPAIAIIDSGIDATRTDFAGRIVANVNLSTLPGNTVPGDGRGHGTFVAGIAAGAAAGYAGAAPTANIVSVDVMDDTGVARTSDVIAGCQWALANKDKYGIGIVNLSLHSVTPSNFTHDPLDRAVEKLWLNGVVVVVAAGNYGSADGPTGVRYAPGNDPFVITVGAVDLGNTVGLGNDSAPTWSAYGYTYDGFWKPEIGAAGRYMVGPIPPNSTLAAQKAANITAPGYIQLSGTSFATPAVAGAAAAILAKHPGFTPDQVKGALMVTAKNAPNAIPFSLGVGELNADKATSISSPPNPNAGLDRFVVSTPTSSGAYDRSFDSVSWEQAAKASVAWDDVAWGDSAWSAAAWSAVAWDDVAWDDVAWQDATAAVAWDDVAWQDVAWEDAAEGDANLEGGYPLSSDDVAAIEADPDLAVAVDALPAQLSAPGPTP